MTRGGLKGGQQHIAVILQWRGSGGIDLGQVAARC